MQSNAARELHLFRTSKNRAVELQVDTGFFVEMDELYKAVLMKLEKPTHHEVIALELTDEFDRSEVLNAIGVLTEAGLIDVGFIPRNYAKPPIQEAIGIAETSLGSDLLHITLHAAHACNVKCAYCFAHGGDYGGPQGLMQPDLSDRPEFKMGDVFSGVDLDVRDTFNESFHVDSRSDCRRCWA